MTQARDAVGGADVLDELSDALDDVTDHVTETSRRLSDVIDRANNVSASVEEQFSGDWLIDIINAVSLSRTVYTVVQAGSEQSGRLEFVPGQYSV